MDWFLYDRDLCHERVKEVIEKLIAFKKNLFLCKQFNQLVTKLSSSIFSASIEELYSKYAITMCN